MTSHSSNGLCNSEVENGASNDQNSSSIRNDILRRRLKHIGPMCTVFFKTDPINVVQARGQYLYDDQGKRYLDCISNVQHVGHCHPLVAKEISHQLSRSSCNSRFLSEKLVLCCEKLKSKLPASLDTVFMCNSGSEANDLALRIAYDYTGGASDVVVIDHAYHGMLSSLIDISPYKFDGPGGRGKPDYVHIAPCPDVYRGLHRLPEEQLQDPKSLEAMGKAYADEVKKIFDRCAKNGRKIRAFIMESLQSCGGQVIPPPGYVERVMMYAHEIGALFITDEVQTGFGRVGSTFWAFQLHNNNFVPDIVTMGKPMGNGFPVSALVTKRSIANRFGGGMEFFNTYGGNPVACVAVLSVMRVIEEEKLMENAFKVGTHMIQRFNELKKQHPWLIGDVRGVGLFIGIELISDSRTRIPATKEARFIIEQMRNRCVILSAEGPHSNVIKIKPPLCFTIENVDEVIDTMSEIIEDLADAMNENKINSPN